MISKEQIVERLETFRPSVLASLLRIGRRLTEGFEGEIHIGAKKGGVNYIRWIQNETGDTIKEELEG